jgi:hypothetical protein
MEYETPPINMINVVDKKRNINETINTQMMRLWIPSNWMTDNGVRTWYVLRCNRRFICLAPKSTFMASRTRSLCKRWPMAWSLLRTIFTPSRRFSVQIWYTRIWSASFDIELYVPLTDKLCLAINLCRLLYDISNSSAIYHTKNPRS